MRTVLIVCIAIVMSSLALAEKADSGGYISSKNIERYKNNLTDGQIALLKANDKVIFKIAALDKGVTFAPDPDWVAYPDPKVGITGYSLNKNNELISVLKRRAEENH